LARGNMKRVTVLLPDDVHLELKLHTVKKMKTLNDCFLEAIEMYMHQSNLIAPEEPTVEL